MTVVVDSGVWISALKFKGTPLLAIETILTKHRIAICEPIVIEIRAALTKKLGWPESEVEEAMAFYSSNAKRVDVQGDLSGICRDPNDDMIFECAVLAGANLIISGDKDILAIKSFRGIRTVSPREFLRLPESI